MNEVGDGRRCRGRMLAITEVGGVGGKRIVVANYWLDERRMMDEENV